MTPRIPSRRLTITALAGLLLVSGVAAAQQEEASVTVVDQDSNGVTIVVSSATLPQGGFLVVHDETLLDGNVKGSIVGSSAFLEAGTHNNVTIIMDSSTEGESVLYVMAHQDTDGDMEYTFQTSEEDGPYTTADGDPVMAAVGIRFQEGRTTETDTATDTSTKTDTDTFTGGLTDDRTPRQGDDGIGDGEGNVGDGEEDTPGVGIGLVVATLAGLALFVARRR